MATLKLLEKQWDLHFKNQTNHKVLNQKTAKIKNRGKNQKREVMTHNLPYPSTYQCPTWEGWRGAGLDGGFHRGTSLDPTALTENSSPSVFVYQAFLFTDYAGNNLQHKRRSLYLMSLTAKSD